MRPEPKELTFAGRPEEFQRFDGGWDRKKLARFGLPEDALIPPDGFGFTPKGFRLKFFHPPPPPS